MGLLNRIENSKNLESTQTMTIRNKEIDSKKKNQVDVFLSLSGNLDSGIEYPGKIFDFLCSCLNILKGALLVLDRSNEVFLSVSNKNIDITTKRHLRVDGKFLQNQFHNYNEIIDSEADCLKGLKQYFSIREFSALSTLLILPLYAQGILGSVVLIIDPDPDILLLSRDISTNSDKITKNLLKSRVPFSKLQGVENIIDNPALILAAFLKKIKDNNTDILIASMNFDNIIKRIAKFLPESDLFQISNDIVNSLKLLIIYSGELIKISTEKYLLFYKLKSGTTSDLILHHINLTISSFFNLTDKLPPIEAEVKVFPSAGISAETILEGIL